MTSKRKSIKTHSKLASWLMCHGQAFFASLGKLCRYPLSNGMTIAVIGIALALPAGLYLLLQNVSVLSSGWDNSAKISLFLKMDVGEDKAAVLLKQLQQDSAIAKAAYISPSEGLQHFQQQSGFGDVLQQLHKNPLPGVIVVDPAADVNSPLLMQELLLHLQHLPQVAQAKLDMTWVKRLYSIIALAERAVWALAALLALAVFLVIGNTISLSIHSQKREIEITKLVGATNAFIRRPFLYMGLLYGFLGAVFAFVCVNVLLLWLAGPVEALTGLYQSNFYLHGFSLFSTEVLFLVAILLGLLGSWLAVGRRLRSIEPQ